jgi:hypothetical protein
MTRRKGPVYPGELGRPASLTDPPLNQLHGIFLLCRQYGIDLDSFKDLSAAFYKLALCLARDHVPYFRTPRPVGRPRTRMVTSMLAADIVSKLREEGMTKEKAIDEAAEILRYAPSTVERELKAFAKLKRTGELDRFSIKEQDFDAIASARKVRSSPRSKRRPKR